MQADAERCILCDCKMTGKVKILAILHIMVFCEYTLLYSYEYLKNRRRVDEKCLLFF